MSVVVLSCVALVSYLVCTTCEKMTVVLLLCITIALLLLFFYRPRPPNFPPGPRRDPILGNMMDLRNHNGTTMIHEKLSLLAAQYGPYMGLFLGQRICVAVHGYDAVKSVLAREDCCMRPDTVNLRNRSFHKRLGIIFTDGPLWKEQRRFTLRHLRDFGFGKCSMEGLIHAEIETLLRKIEERVDSTPNSSSEGVLLQDLFPVAVINILWAIMAGVRYDHSNSEFRKLLGYVDDFFRHGNPTGGPIFIFPILRHVPLVNNSHKKQDESVRALQNFIKSTIQEHMETYQDECTRDFIDVYLSEINNKEGKDSFFSEEQLIVLCMDLFLAGAETTSSALAHMLRYLLMYPELQAQLGDEIMNVVGTGRLPTLHDAFELHLLQAFIHETLRHSSMAPIAVSHLTACDLQLGPYNVPKDTFLILNLHSVHMEAEHWGDPQVFRPQRFLNASGKFVKDDHLLPFGFGPRLCLGEPLARNSLFLFIAALLQRFSFLAPSDGPPLKMDNVPGLTIVPKPFNVVVATT